MNEKTFSDAVCERFGVSPERYAEEVLWRCFFPSARIAGKLLWVLNPAYFDHDLELIQDVADCMNAAEVRMALNDFRYHRPLKGLGRRFLRLRVSGQRLVELAHLVLQ